MLALVLWISHIALQILTLPFSYLILRLWWAALRPQVQPLQQTSSAVTRFIILVPAHNEETSITATVQSLKALDYPEDRFEILVIADNCSDATASAARQAGAAVLERRHETERSKGFALEYALQSLQKRASPPAAIVIIDADTAVDPGLLRVFDRRLSQGQDSIQAYYTVSNPDDSWRTQLMTFAFAHFNGVWLAGQDALGYGSALRGNGMAFSWAGLQRCPWQAYGLAEDLEFSWRLRLAGERVKFAAEVRVYGEMIDRHPQGVAAQRLRWEHGRRQLRQTFSKQIQQSSWPRSLKYLALFDLHMPALAGYVLRLAAVLATGLGLSVVPASGFDGTAAGFMLALALLQLFNFLIYLYMPFQLMGLPWSYLKLFFFAPFYVLWKASLLLRKAPSAWVRTVRKPKP